MGTCKKDTLKIEHLERDFLQNSVSIETSAVSNPFKMTQITGQILNYFNLLMTHYRAEENTKDFSIYCARVSRDAVCVHWHDRLQVESHWDNERVT